MRSLKYVCAVAALSALHANASPLEPTCARVPDLSFIHEANAEGVNPEYDAAILRRVDIDELMLAVQASIPDDTHEFDHQEDDELTELSRDIDRLHLVKRATDEESSTSTSSTTSASDAIIEIDANPRPRSRAHLATLCVDGCCKLAVIFHHIAEMGTRSMLASVFNRAATAAVADKAIPSSYLGVFAQAGSVATHGAAIGTALAFFNLAIVIGYATPFFLASVAARSNSNSRGITAVETYGALSGILAPPALLATETWFLGKLFAIDTLQEAKAAFLMNVAISLIPELPLSRSRFDQVLQTMYKCVTHGLLGLHIARFMLKNYVGPSAVAACSMILALRRFPPVTPQPEEVAQVASVERELASFTPGLPGYVLDELPEDVADMLLYTRGRIREVRPDYFLLPPSTATW